MFNRFTKIFNTAVDALQPSLPPHQEFVTHWKAVTNYFMQNKEHKISIDQTGIPRHLDQMINILMEEEESSDAGSTASSMEYLLQHKILETLYTLARTDCPPGMKQHVLMFFTKLLSHIRQPLLPHINVHRAVHRLIRVCGETKAAPSENEEIHFLCTVCAKVYQHQYLANFFIEKPRQPDPGGSTPSFGLVDALLSLMHSADGRVAVKACEGLMLCANLNEADAVDVICNNTQLAKQLADTLVSLYKNIDKPLLYHKYHYIDDVHAKWGLDIHSSSDDRQSFPGKRALISFLSWLDYCDQLIYSANNTIAQAVASEMAVQFIDKVVKPDIVQVSESGSVVSTILLCQCLREVNSHTLLTAFTSSLLGVREDFVLQLINRCNHLNEEICTVTLKLFEVLLCKPDPSVTEHLVLYSIADRRYAAVSPTHTPKHTDDTSIRSVDENKGSSSSTSASTNASSVHHDSVDASIEDGATSQEEPSGGTQSSAADTADTPPASPSSANTDSGSDIHQVVHSFLNLLPDDAKSSYQSSESAYDTYLRDAFKQYSDVTSRCVNFAWPTQLPSSSDSKPSASENFTEAPFIKVLFDKLLHILDQGYDSNLQLTSVISQLALLPHPVLHDYLLNPHLTPSTGARTLTCVLKKVIHDIEKRKSSVSDFQNELLIVRKRLMGMDDSIRRIKPTCVQYSIEETKLYEGIIIVEEFCKELAAIAFVKHHAIT